MPIALSWWPPRLDIVDCVGILVPTVRVYRRRVVFFGPTAAIQDAVRPGIAHDRGIDQD